jgi:hypothetical protein
MYSPSPMTMHDPVAMLIMIPSDWHQNSTVPETADDELGNDRLRRETIAAIRSSGGPLTDLTPAAHPRGQEPLKMPQSCHLSEVLCRRFRG